MPPDTNRERVLTTLLEDLFDPSELLRLARELDGGLYNELIGRNLGLRDLSDELVRKSVKRGLIDGEFFAIVHRDRTKLGPQIGEVAGLWGVEVAAHSSSPTPAIEPNEMPTPRREPIDIFISYSHKDEEWKDRLVGQLQVLAHEGSITVWDDTHIAAGDTWKPAIDMAMTEARAAILLVSADFLTSKFVRSVEVPQLLKRRQAEGVRIFPIIARPCAWQIVDWLSALQCRPQEGKALSLCNDGEIDHHLSELVLEIHKLLTVPTTPPAEKSKPREPTITPVNLPTPPRRTTKPAPEPAIVDPVPMVDIPAGSFVMGSPDSDDMAHDDEKPVHEVRLSAFRCMVTPVTRTQWAKVMGAGHKWAPEGPDDDQPVNNITWFDAVRFCNALSKKMALEPCYRIDGDQVDWVSNEGYRLPTEAEWEYACRAGSQTLWCFGDDPEQIGEYAWFRDNSGEEQHPVGQKRANAWGLYDMHGNVWEWVWDWYGDYPNGTQTDPKGLVKADAKTVSFLNTSGKVRLLRGGSFLDGAGFTRCASRNWYEPVYRDGHDGFRCVRGSGRQP